MMWFDKHDSRALFIDNRAESFVLKDSSDRRGFRPFTVCPDMLADFTSLPFEDGRFPLVVFDPPHSRHHGSDGWMRKRYGSLGPEWRDTLRRGFAECFRVLCTHGTLVFKWNECDIRVSEILALTPVKPLFGHKSGKASKTHWIVFMKTQDGAPNAEEGRTQPTTGAA